MFKKLVATLLTLTMILSSVSIASAEVVPNGNTIKINNEVITASKVIYVSPSGNDKTGNGTQSNPFKTFYAAEAIAVI